MKIYQNDDYFVISKEEVKEQIANAKHFYETIAAYLEVRCDEKK